MVNYFARRLERTSQRLKPQQERSAAQRVQVPATFTPGHLLRQSGKLWEALVQATAETVNATEAREVRTELRAIGLRLQVLDHLAPESEVAPEIVEAWMSIRDRVISCCERPR